MAYKNILPVDTNSNKINLGSEESILLLRKICKLVESNATVDSQGRQKVVFDNDDSVLGSGTVGIAATLVYNTTTNGVPSSFFTAAFCNGTLGVNAPTYDSTWFLFDIAANTYAMSIRQGMIWT